MSMLHRLLTVLCILAPALLLAAGYEPETVPEPAGGPSGPQRRTVGLFTRLFNSPSRTNAVEQLAYARQLEAEGKTRRALKAYKAAFLFWQTSPQAPEALHAFAKLFEKSGRYSDAFEEYQYLVDAYSGRFPYEDVVRTQFKMANEVRTETYARWFLGIGFVSPERAIPLFYQVASNAPTLDLAPEALMHAGTIQQEKRLYDDAIATYASVQTRYPSTPQAEEAAFLMLQCMMSIARDQPYNTQHALSTKEALKQYLQDHPGSPHEQEIRAELKLLDQREAQTLYESAYVYEKAKKFKVAAEAYEKLIATFPDFPQAELAKQKLKTLRPKPASQEKTP